MSTPASSLNTPVQSTIPMPIVTHAMPSATTIAGSNALDLDNMNALQVLHSTNSPAARSPLQASAANQEGMLACVTETMNMLTLGIQAQALMQCQLCRATFNWMATCVTMCIQMA